MSACEWNPLEDRPALDTDRFHATATVSVGHDGRWHLCGDCAALPRFNRFTARRSLREPGDSIARTVYRHGDEVQHLPAVDCPDRCTVPAGAKLVQIVTPGTAGSTPCPSDCGIAMRMVK